MNKIKRTLLIIISSICLLSYFDTYAIVSPTDEFYVNDYANILSKETEAYIIEHSRRLNSVDGTQIVVVTVKNLEGKSLEDYATTLFRNFGIGNKNKNNGLLLLLALEEREFRVEVGYGLEGILPDGKTGRFQDQYIIPYLKNNDWDKGIINGYNAFFEEIVKQNNLTIDYDKPIDNGDYQSSSFVISIILFIVGYACGQLISDKDTKEVTRKVITAISFIIFLLMFTHILPAIIKICTFAYCLGFIIGFITISLGGSSSSNSRRYGHGSYRSSSSHSSSHHSSGSFGGGGRSGGGGSSRHF